MANDDPKPKGGRPPGNRHRWSLNLWVTDAEEAKLRSFFTRRDQIESMSEAARRLLLGEVETPGSE